MAASAPMRDGPPAGSGTGGDSLVTVTTTFSSSSSSSCSSSTSSASPSSAAAAAAIPSASSSSSSSTTVVVSTTPLSSSTTTSSTNFEYDDNDWETGINDNINSLITDLDKDIEQTDTDQIISSASTGGVGLATVASNLVSTTSSTSSTCGSGGSMAAPSTTNATGSVSGSKNNVKNSAAGNSSSSSSSSSSSNSSTGGGNSSSNSGGITQPITGTLSVASTATSSEHCLTVENKSLKMKIKRTKSGSKSSEKHEIVKTSSSSAASSCNSVTSIDQQNGSGTDNNVGLLPDSGKISSFTSTSTANKHGSSSSSSSNSAFSSSVTTQGSVVTSGSTSSSSSGNVNGSGSKRGSSGGHRRDKNKHSSGSSDKSSGSGSKSLSSSSTQSSSSSSSSSSAANQTTGSANSTSLLSSGNNVDLNGVNRTSSSTNIATSPSSVSSTPMTQRVSFPTQTNGPGPPTGAAGSSQGGVMCNKDQQTNCGGTGGGNASTNVSPPIATSNHLMSHPSSGTIGSSIVTTRDSGIGGSTLPMADNHGSGSTSSNTCDDSNTICSKNVETQSSSGSPPCKKSKNSAPNSNCSVGDSKDMKDVCVGTSISTMTEPDCLGHCEPGTSVTLEGIVWHETDGILVVNVTWRGKTYIGTLLDCSRHEWAPPRFCDSPTSDLDARLPKGRGAKRGRAASGDLSNFTETRSSVHSKLRSSSQNNNSKNTRKGLSNSPTPFAPPKPESGSNKRKLRPADEELTASSPQANGKKSKTSQSNTGASTGASSGVGSGNALGQSSTTTPLSPSSPPTFFECPETNCCKKYRHVSGLKYHQSHVHGGSPCGVDDEEGTKDSVASMSETEEIPSPCESLQSTLKPSPTSTNDNGGTITGKIDNAMDTSEPPSDVVMPISEVATTTSATTSIFPPSEPVMSSNTVATSTCPLGLDLPEPVRVDLNPPPVDNKNVIKPGALKFGAIATSTDDPITTMPVVVSSIPTALTPTNCGSTASNIAIGGSLQPPPIAPLIPTTSPAISGVIPSSIGGGGGHNSSATMTTMSTLSASSPLSSTMVQQPQLSHQVPLSPSHGLMSQQMPSTHPFPSSQQQPPQNIMGTMAPNPAGVTGVKTPQFKVKPTSVLMQEDKLAEKNKCLQQQQQQQPKKKGRKLSNENSHLMMQQSSPIDSMQYKLMDTGVVTSAGREDVHSPAYSDISDDGAPVLEAEMSSEMKSKSSSVGALHMDNGGAMGKKIPSDGVVGGHTPLTGPPPGMQHFSPMYHYYGQPPFLMPSVQQDAMKKDDRSGANSVGPNEENAAKILIDKERERKDSNAAANAAAAASEAMSAAAASQKLLASHYNPYDMYAVNYGYNLSQGYPISMMSATTGVGAPGSDKEIKEESRSPGPTDLANKQQQQQQQQQSTNMHPISGQGINSPYPGIPQSNPTQKSSKLETHTSGNSKINSEPYGMVKDRSEARSPINPSFNYHRQQQQQQQHLQQIQQIQNMQQQMHGHSTAQQQTSPHPSQQPPSHQLGSSAHQQQQQQQHEDNMRRYYGHSYPDQRRKDQQQLPSPQHQQQQQQQHPEMPLKATPPPTNMSSKSSAGSGSKHKEKQQQQQQQQHQIMMDEKKESEKSKQQEGVKPTMETQGPPPPPTSQYATYFHPSNYHLQPPYVSFDPSAYRGINPMMVPAGPYGASPYLHHPTAAQVHAAQIPRYHAPEDLSRPPSGSGPGGPKSMDLLQHQASQYYTPSAHKIHELQERAIKSPTPKSVSGPGGGVGGPNASPVIAPNGQPPLNASQLTPTSTADRLSAVGINNPGGQVLKPGGMDGGVGGKDNRSPPPQRHVHTHHHTHVGIGYPLLPAGQYAPPYGTAVLASEQAAAVASAGNNPYSPK